MLEMEPKLACATQEALAREGKRDAAGSSKKQAVQESTAKRKKGIFSSTFSLESSTFPFLIYISVQPILFFLPSPF